MVLTGDFIHHLASAWEVLMLFVIPIGGGIPAGVLLAKTKGLPWPEMTVLYFISDVILACVFDPVMHAVVRAGKSNPAVAKFAQTMKESVQKTTARYGAKLGPVTLILISFGVDPMTGRGATVLAGHGFLTGWGLAITGDMFFYMLLMGSTLWLNGILGDGTWATVTIMVTMMLISVVVRRAREAWVSRPAT